MKWSIIIQNAPMCIFPNLFFEIQEPVSKERTHYLWKDETDDIYCNDRTLDIFLWWKKCFHNGGFSLVESLQENMSAWSPSGMEQEGRKKEQE